MKQMPMAAWARMNEMPIAWWVRINDMPMASWVRMKKNAHGRVGRFSFLFVAARQ